LGIACWHYLRGLYIFANKVLEQMMSDNRKQGLITKQTLTDTELTEIEQLGHICDNYENLHVRIDWIKLRPQGGDETNDFLYYEDGILVGYLVVDAYGTEEVELTGMVHPDYRRKRIFTTLLTAAKQECRGRGVRKLVLVCEQSSRSGQAFIATSGAHHDFSEYRMVLETFREKKVFDDRLFFREAYQSDLEALVTILIDGSDDTVEEVKSYIREGFNEPYCHFYLATFGEASLGCKEPIGCLRLYDMADEVGIYGFVVRPEYRGRGYGRQMLEETIRTIQAGSQKRIMLEVDTGNANAIGLYRSSGFKETTTYGYYSIAMEKQDF
jgi:ribosomal protein S18 acetylase RimI-like enzyme